MAQQIRAREQATSRLGADLADVAQEQIAEVRHEVRRAMQGTVTSAGRLVVAGVAASVAVGAAATTALRMLERAMPRTRAAATLAIGSGAVAAGLAASASERLREVARGYGRMRREVGHAVGATARAAAREQRSWQVNPRP